MVTQACCLLFELNLIIFGLLFSNCICKTCKHVFTRYSRTEHFRSLLLLSCFLGEDDSFVDHYDCLNYGSDVDGKDKHEF